MITRAGDDGAITEREDAPDMYWKLYDAISPALKKIHRVDIVDAENLPAAGEGGVILAAIHNGALDGVFIAIAAAHRGRAVRFIGDEDICDAPVIGKAIRDAGVIPIASHKGVGSDPEQIRGALAEAAGVITGGGTLGLFPEGAIRPFFDTRNSIPFKTGVIRLAIATGAPVVPVWAQGAGAIFPWLSPFTIKGKKFYGAIPLWTPSHIRVRFGEAFVVRKELTLDSPREELKAETARLQDAADFLRNAGRASRG